MTYTKDTFLAKMDFLSLFPYCYFRGVTFNYFYPYGHLDRPLYNTITLIQLQTWCSNPSIFFVGFMHIYQSNRNKLNSLIHQRALSLI